LRIKSSLIDKEKHGQSIEAIEAQFGKKKKPVIPSGMRFNMSKAEFRNLMTFKNPPLGLPNVFKSTNENTNSTVFKKNL
jgi:hypothetical protein